MMRSCGLSLRRGKVDAQGPTASRLGTMTTHAAFQSGEYLAVRIHATDTDTVERDLRVAFLLDISDSMSGERLESVKRTLEAARDLFRDSDRITVVTFGDQGHVLAGGVTPATVYERIADLQTDGCTNLSHGLETLFALHGTWDAVILLTDGHVNVGVTSVTGLLAMAAGIGTMPFYTLGYGADHNQRLLRELALNSCGSYTYADSDEVLPVAIGDMIAGLRTQVWSDVRVNVPGTLECLEIGRGRVGGVVAGRDYWVVFRGCERLASDSLTVVTTEAVETVTVTNGPDTIATLTVEPVPADDVIVQEQVFRCRVAALMNRAAADPRQVRQQLTELQDELAVADTTLCSRPLMLRMTGQIAELLAATAGAANHLSPLHRTFIGIADEDTVSADLLTRLNSNAVYYSMQRGTQSVGDPDVFCSPMQRTTSSQVQSRYHGM
jgi:Mg-chelatase subunit ChlD